MFDEDDIDDYLEQVESSNLESVYWDSETEVLYIKFLNGSLYKYEDVPEDVYNELMEADSHGQYFYWEIREGGYSYERLG